MCERNSNKQVTSVGSTISSKLNPKLELDSSQTDDTSIAATSTAVTIHSSNLNKKLVKIKKFKLDDMKEMVGGCCVCSDERGWPENPLVYCDGQNCTVAVHQACYGIVTVPTGPWYCRKCESQERTSRVRCELCPSRDGALKKTDNSGWAHVVCALYIPEVRFGNVTTMEPIILTLIPQERYSKTCYICLEIGKPNRANVGACMQCNKSNCKQQFHVTCAQSLGLLCEEAGNYLDNVKYCGYCQHHYSKLKKGGNVKTIPPYKPIQHDTSSDSCSSPEKEIDSTINAASTSGTSIKITSTTNLGISSVSSINTGGIAGAGSGVSSTKQRKGNASGKSSSSSSSSSSSGSSTGSGGGGGVNVSGTDRQNLSTSSTSGSSTISMTNTSAGTTSFTSTSNISNLAGNLTAASVSPSPAAGGPITASSTTLPSLAATSSSVSSATAPTKFSTSASSASSSIYKDKHSKNLNKSSSSKDKEKEGSANNASNNNSSSLSSVNSSLSVSGSSLSSASTKSSSKSNKNKDLMQSNVTTSITTQPSSTSTIASNTSTSGSNISSSATGTTSCTSSSLTSSSHELAQNLSTNQPIAGGKSSGFDSELSRSGPNPSSMNDSSTSSYAITLEPRDHGLTQRTSSTTTTPAATNLSTSKGLTSSTSSGSPTTSLAPTSTSNPTTTSSSSLNSTSKKRKADSIKSSSAVSASSAVLDENSSFRDIIKDVQVTLTPLTDFEKEIEKTSKRQRTELSPPTHQSSATAEVNASLAPATCAAISTTSATGSSSSSGSTTTANTSSSNIASGSTATIGSNNNATTGSGLPASNFAKSDISKTIGSGTKHGSNGGIKDTTSTSGSSSSSGNQQQATGANANAPSLYVSVPLSTANVPGINLPNASGSVTGNGTGTSIDSSQSATRSGSTPAQPSLSNQNQSSLGTTGNAAYVTPHSANSLSGTPASSNTSTSASSSSSSSLSALSSSVIQHQHPSGKSSTASALSGGTSGALVSGNCGGNIISSTSTSTTHSSGNLTATTTESGNLKISYEKQTSRVQQLQEQESSPGRRSRTPDLNSGTVSTSAISASGNSNANSSSFSGLKFTYEAQSQLDVAMLPVSSIKDSPPSSPGSEIGVNPHPAIANQPPPVNTAGAAVGGNIRKRGRKAKDPTLATQAAAQAVADLKDVRILQNGGNNSATASNSATTIGSPLVPAPTPPATPSISVSASSSSSTSIIAHTATHMLGNHVNPNSSVAQKLSEQLHMEVQDHAIYTPDSMNSQFTGVPFPGKQRNSTTSSSSGNIANTLVAPNPLQSMFGGGGINGNMPIPQSLEQLLERQWEQGSQFLMEQAQHFDIASLLNCLHQLQSENLRLEEHVTSLIARRDHLLAVNARLQIPLSTISNNAKAEAHASGGNNSNISSALNAATTIAAAVSLATTAINTSTPTGNSRSTVAAASSSGVVLDYRGSSGNNNSNCINSASASASTPAGGPSSTPSSGSQSTGMSIGSMAMSNVTNFALRHLASTHATYNNAGTNSSSQSQQQNSVAPATIGRVPTKARR